MIVRIGDRVSGYKEIDSYLITKKEMEKYIDKFKNSDDDYIKENVRFARDFVDGRNLSKYAGLVSKVVITSIALFLMVTTDFIIPEDALASAKTSIDIQPLNKIFNEVYWTMVRVLMILSAPIWAWVGYTLALGGANSEKRTQAKKIATSLVVGSVVVVGAKWATEQLWKLLQHIFA